MPNAWPEVETEGRLVKYVLADIRAALEGMGMLSDENDWSDTFTSGAVWPVNPRWVCAYVVRGSNEGWYAHLDAIPSGIGSRAFPGQYGEANVNLGLAKFWSRDLAYDYCKATMHLLEGTR